MNIRATFFALATITATAASAEPPLSCEGNEPDWFLTLAGPEAQFRYDKRKTGFKIPQSNAAEGHDWPRAYTLVSDFDTAIVLINEATCMLGNTSWPNAAHILTQRGQTPILLTGCCTVAE